LARVLATERRQKLGERVGTREGAHICDARRRLIGVQGGRAAPSRSGDVRTSFVGRRIGARHGVGELPRLFQILELVGSEALVQAGAEGHIELFALLGGRAAKPLVVAGRTGDALVAAALIPAGASTLSSRARTATAATAATAPTARSTPLAKDQRRPADE
jgi:hypothetical protein